ncbi:hypothetical protein [uncultured Enterovirga sp.]|uniref:hypothetical protein n=1 Tax=uncultured Enterovirga sp. TaxID=2026352 RepID=UPI0035CAC5E7
MTAGDERSFSTAFDKLVRTDASGDEDIIGLLAYAIYKRDKRDLAVSGALDETHLRQHHKTLTPGLVEQYRDGALRRLEIFSSAVLARAEPDIREAARVEAVERARDDIISVVRTSTTWWVSILWNVIAWLISLAIVFLVTVGTGKVSFQISG